MAFHVVDRPANLGQLLGQGLGTGLGGHISGTLENLAAQRAQQMQQRNLASQLKSSMPGISGEQANLLSLVAQVNPKSFFPALQATEIEQQPLEEMIPQEQTIAPTPQQQKSLQEHLQNKRLTPEQKTRLKEHFAQQAPQQIAQPAQAQPQTKKLFGETPTQRLNREKVVRAQQSKIDKETFPFFNEVNKEAKAAKNADIRLNRMQELIDRGQLSWPLTASLVKGASKIILGHGLDLSGLLTADTQEFDKLSQDFLRDAKDIFGSRLTNFDVDSFLKTVPSITQSEAGKRAVIRDLKIMNDAKKVKQSAMNEIIRENGGYRPPNIEELVNERVEPELDRLANEFRSGTAKAPEGRKQFRLPGQPEPR